MFFFFYFNKNIKSNFSEKYRIIKVLKYNLFYKVLTKIL
jgi:hypothetical protein